MLLHCQPRVSMLVHTVSSERNGFITVPFARVSECFFISCPRASRLGLLNFCHNTNFVKKYLFPRYIYYMSLLWIVCWQLYVCRIFHKWKSFWSSPSWTVIILSMSFRLHVVHCTNLFYNFYRVTLFKQPCEITNCQNCYVIS